MCCIVPAVRKDGLQKGEIAISTIKLLGTARVCSACLDNVHSEGTVVQGLGGHATVNLVPWAQPVPSILFSLHAARVS